jgi:DnaJ family protein B protein 12
MDTNKEEAIRCLKIAKNQYGSKNYEAAIRLTNKSINLFPTDEAKEFLLKAEKAAATNSSSSTSTPTTGTPPQTSSQTSKQTKEKPFASQQTTEVREVLSCGTDYYKVLQVGKKCTETEIKKSYRKVNAEYVYHHKEFVCLSLNVSARSQISS